jgi:FHS family L-fucose permease-like MFS transporter
VSKYFCIDDFGSNTRGVTYFILGALFIVAFSLQQTSAQPFAASLGEAIPLQVD